ncbi:TPA: hypothetical protein NGW16_004192 [Vibrio parahaemolyticus]|nr:hypothetical protein [Vibrio parahaemolyticus]
MSNEKYNFDNEIYFLQYQMEKEGWSYGTYHSDRYLQYNLKTNNEMFEMILIDEGDDLYSLQINTNKVFATFKSTKERMNTKLFNNQYDVFELALMITYYREEKHRNRDPELIKFFKKEMLNKIASMGYKIRKDTIDKRQKRKPRF